MLDADVDPFLDVSVANALVYNDPHCGLSDVVDDAGFAVVDFMWHAVYYQNHHTNSSQVRRGVADPFCTAPLALISTMSPTLRILSMYAEIQSYEQKRTCTVSDMSRA